MKSNEDQPRRHDALLKIGAVTVFLATSAFLVSAWLSASVPPLEAPRTALEPVVDWSRHPTGRDLSSVLAENDRGAFVAVFQDVVQGEQRKGPAWSWLCAIVTARFRQGPEEFEDWALGLAHEEGFAGAWFRAFPGLPLLRTGRDHRLHLARVLEESWGALLDNEDEELRAALLQLMVILHRNEELTDQQLRSVLAGSEYLSPSHLRRLLETAHRREDGFRAVLSRIRVALDSSVRETRLQAARALAFLGKGPFQTCQPDNSFFLTGGAPSRARWQELLATVAARDGPEAGEILAEATTLPFRELLMAQRSSRHPAHRGEARRRLEELDLELQARWKQRRLPRRISRPPPVASEQFSPWLKALFPKETP